MEERRGNSLGWVQGEGPTPARWCIIGEAPGREEVAEGRPFIGKSGQLLRQALRDLGLNEGDIYITNLVKELPLDQDRKIRRPNQEEIDFWYPVHVHEMMLVTPKDPPFAKLLLGRTCMDVLGNGGELGTQVDKFTWSAWHPAYLIRNGGSDILPSTGEPAYKSRKVSYDKWLEQLRPWAEGGNTP